MRTDQTGHEITATTEEVGVYHMLLTEAIFEALAEKGIVSKKDVMERIEKLKRKTHLILNRLH
jgi:hypothetical protein